MNSFVDTLRAEVDQAQRALTEARLAGDGNQVHRSGARLLDLLDRAKSNGVDTTGWVPPELIALASTAAGNES